MAALARGCSAAILVNTRCVTEPVSRCCARRWDLCGNQLRPDAERARNNLAVCGLDNRADQRPEPIIFEHLAQKTAVRFNRRIARPLLGRFLAEPSYESILQSFRPNDVTIA